MKTTNNKRINKNGRINIKTNEEINRENNYFVRFKFSIVGGLKMTPEEEKVLKAMKSIGKPVKPGDVAEATGIDSKEVSKIIASLKKQDLVDSPKRCFYAPK